MKIVVTGAGGFIGWHLVNRLKKDGHWVRGVDVKRPEFAPSSANEFLKIDLREKKNCIKAVKDMDWVYNLAANMGGIGYIRKVFAPIIYDNALINLNMIEAAKDEGIKRYFYSSSACVYPEYRQNKPHVSGLKEHEAVPADPDSYYGWEKLFSEFLLEAYHKDYGMEIRIARFHNIFGPYGTYEGGKEKAPAALCRKVILAENGGEIEIWGDGKQTRSFCYIDDCIEGFLRLMGSDRNEPLNIGSDRMISIDKLADIIIKISGKKLRKKHNLNAIQGVRGRNSDNSEMKELLEWEPEKTLEDGLEITYNWIKKEIEDKR